MAVGSKVIVKDRDLGWRKLARMVRSPLQMGVEVGVRGEDAQREGGGPSNVEIAEFHEFGLGNNPERSFIRATIDNNVLVYRLLVKGLAKKVYRLKMTERDALTILGMKVKSDIQKRIREGIAPELKPATKARKGGKKDTPLIDTAQLIRAITFHVVRGA